MIAFWCAMTIDGADGFHTMTVVGHAMYFICMCRWTLATFFGLVAIHHDVDRVGRPFASEAGIPSEYLG
jgi:hypothetical protein